MSTFYQLPAVSERVVLLTHLAVREDAHQLYGFGDGRRARGVPRADPDLRHRRPDRARRCCPGLSVTELAQAVTLQESGRLTRIPGIGKKTAERLMLELKGKLGAELGTAATPAAGDSHADVLHALLALGYNEREAASAVRTLPAGTGVSDGIRLALKSLAKG